MRVERQYAQMGNRQVPIGWRFQLTRRGRWHYVLSDLFAERAIRDTKAEDE